MPTVLVADDSALIHRMFSKFFEGSEFEIVADAKDGKEAVELYKEHNPDIVTLDITMPEMNGIEALEEIRKHDPDAACFMCTVLEQKHLIAQAISKGAKGYLIKPFKPEDILKKLRPFPQKSSHG